MYGCSLAFLLPLYWPVYFLFFWPPPPWDNKAKANDIRLEMKITDNTAQLTITNSRIKLPTALVLKLGHPTLKADDRDSLLQRKGQEKSYQGFIETLRDGRYYIQIESLEQQWRVRKDVWVKNGTLVAL